MLLLFGATYAQEPASQSTEKSDWLPSFTTIIVDGALDIKLVQVSADQAPKVVYDTKGAADTKFRAEVKNKVLQIREKQLSERTERTQVTLYYNQISGLTVTDASVEFADTLADKMLDISVNGSAKLKAQVALQDLDLHIMGSSEVELSGEARYLTLFVSTAKFEGSNLQVMAASVTAQSTASVQLHVTERLVVKSTTGAVVNYTGSPSLLRLSR